MELIRTREKNPVLKKKCKKAEPNERQVESPVRLREGLKFRTIRFL